MRGMIIAHRKDRRHSAPQSCSIDLDQICQSDALKFLQDSFQTSRSVVRALGQVIDVIESVIEIIVGPESPRIVIPREKSRIFVDYRRK